MFLHDTSKSKFGLIQFFILICIIVFSANNINGQPLTAEEKIALEEERKRAEAEAQGGALGNFGDTVQSPKRKVTRSAPTSNKKTMGATSAKSTEAATQKKAKSTSSYTTNASTEELQNAINIFNEDFCPPNEPINSINEDELLRLVQAELIARKKITEFSKLKLIEGKVYVHKKNTVPTAVMKKVTRKNFMGSFNSACEAITKNQTHGDLKGNVIPPRKYFKPSDITFRDRNGNRHKINTSCPEMKCVNPLKINGKRYKSVKDYISNVVRGKKTSSSWLNRIKDVAKKVIQKNVTLKPSATDQIKDVPEITWPTKVATASETLTSSNR